MTDREKAIVMAYTGETMLTNDIINAFYLYVDKLFGRHVYQYEIQTLGNRIKEMSKDDFDALRTS